MAVCILSPYKIEKKNKIDKYNDAPINIKNGKCKNTYNLINKNYFNLFTTLDRVLSPNMKQFHQDMP